MQKKLKKTKKLEVSVDAIANFNDGTSAIDVTNCLVWRTFCNVMVDRVRVDGVNTWTNDTC
jgi:hypothetical protein